MNRAYTYDAVAEQDEPRTHDRWIHLFQHFAASHQAIEPESDVNKISEILHLN